MGVRELQPLSRDRGEDPRRFTRLGQVPALDGLRGIAILLVLAHHSGLLVGGWLGVDLFFVLSGFLITSLLLTKWWEHGTFTLRAFYSRRARRLLPALALMLAAYVAVTGDLRGAGFGAAFLMNVVPSLGLNVPDELGHLWSLATEEQFYLLWPPILLVLLNRGVRPRSLMLGLAVSLAVELACSPWFDLRAAPILLGCMAGVAFSFGLLPQLDRSLVLVAFAVCAALTVFARTDRVVPAYSFVFALGACALLCACFEPNWLRGLLTLGPLRYLGRISYGLYLWHYPIYWQVGWILGLPLLGLPLSLSIAILSHRYIEQPFLRRAGRPQRAAPKQPTPARTSVVPSVS